MEKINHTSPLVSVIIVCYNSSQYILETLESAKNQTYANIELVVTDDCSTDNSVEICRRWMAENSARFVRTEIVTTSKNSGIAPNCNRGLYASKGEWLKFIAGDDLLLDYCVETMVNEVRRDDNIQILFSNVAKNGNLSEKDEIIEPFYFQTAEEQYRSLVRSNIILAPSSFVKRETFIELGGFNERYPLLEDLPVYLKALRSNIKLYKLKQQLVNYRVHENNISMGRKMNVQYQKSLNLFYEDELLKELWRTRSYLHFTHHLNIYFLSKLVTLRVIKNFKTFKLFNEFLSPLHWKNRFAGLLG